MCIRTTTPYRFKIGDKVRVITKGECYGMAGTITRRFRLFKAILPVLAPENYYEVIFEKDLKKEAYKEDNLEPI